MVTNLSGDNPMRKILITLLCFVFVCTSFAKDQNELTPLDKEWYINPFGKENPVFYGGPELFASSRMGQVYLPGAGVSLLRPMYIFSSNMMGSQAALNLGGVATDYIAHVAWRLGCDQGYLAAKELKFQEYPSVGTYLMGESKDYRFGKLEGISLGVDTISHPSLGSKLNQTITPTALLLFGAGQVIGQRYFGPFVTKQLSKLKFFGKKMSPAMSGASMDMYGWPVVGAQFARADAVGKLSGILLGTYLGWSLNDFGWQLANWRKFSTDSFSEYMPYHGNDDFGSIDKGWGILGFTLGGFFGHNIGYSLAQSGMTKLGMATTTNVEKFKGTRNFSKLQKGSVTAIGHGTAIGSNLLLGLTLTTYFPYIYKTIFNKFDRPQTQQGLQNLTDLAPEKQDQYISEYVKSSLDQGFIELFQAHQSTVRKTYKQISMEIAQARLTPDFGELSVEEINDRDEKLELLELLESQQETLKNLVEAMSDNIRLLFSNYAKELERMQTLEDLKKFVAIELDGLLPGQLYLDKSAAIAQVVASMNDESRLDKYKLRFLELVVFFYPYVYKYQVAEKMKSFADKMQLNDPLIAYLLHKRDIVTMQLSEVYVLNPERAEELRKEFQLIHKELIGFNYEYYQQNPELIANYAKALDEFSEKLSGLRR